MTIATFPLPPRDALGNSQPLPARFVATLPVTPGATVVIGAPSGSGAITVLSPQGQPIASGSGSVTVSPTTSRVVLTVDSPQPGYVTAVQVASGGTLLPDPSASGLVLGSTGVEQGDWDWTSPANLGSPGAVGDVLTATGTGVGDYDWAAVLPTPVSVGQVLASDGTAAGDWEWISAGGGVLANNTYDGTVSYALSSTAAALDTTNLSVSFALPPSGAALVTFSAFVEADAADVFFVGMDAAGAQVTASAAVVDGSFDGRLSATMLYTGTPGDVVTLYFGAFLSSGSATIALGSGYGPALMRAEALS